MICGLNFSSVCMLSDWLLGIVQNDAGRSTESTKFPIFRKVSYATLTNPQMQPADELFIYHKRMTFFFNFKQFKFDCFRPKYRYPYYDENGKGKLLYGYGGPELYQYKSYSPLEGIH